MNLVEVKDKSKEIFDSWFSIFATEGESENKERLFEIFYSGYLAGTRFNSGEKSNRDISRLIKDDVNKNLDL